MASRKLIRDSLLCRRTALFQQITLKQGSTAGLRRLSSSNRGFSVFKDFSNKIKGEAERNPEFEKTVKDLKDKAEDLKEKAEKLKVRTKQTTEQLYKHVDDVWTESEHSVKKVSSNMKEKISAATEEVKETFRMGSADASAKPGNKSENGSQTSSEEAKNEQSGSNNKTNTFYGKFKSTITSPKVTMAFQKLKEAKVVDIGKKVYGAVKDEITGNESKRKYLEYNPPPSWTGERSTRTDLVVAPAKQSMWSKLREKMQDYPLFKRFGGMSEPVVSKGQELAEDMRERWETSDNPIVHKIQDMNETIFQETDAAATVKEIQRRDPSFSLPVFVSEVQDIVRPVLNAYMKGDAETLKKYCSSEVIERCLAEHNVFQSQGMFFDNKILHISDVEVRETKMMGSSPIIIVAFQTQQVYCIRDREGLITEGGKDTIHTVYYAWAMQQVDIDDLGEGAQYAIWKLKEMQQLGIQTLI